MEEKAKLEIIAQKLENRKKRLEIVETKNDLVVKDQKMIIDQINNLRELITEMVRDEDKTLFASEPKYKQVFDGEEIKKLKKKIWNLLEKFEK